MSSVCPECGLKFQCLCAAIPKLTAPFQLSLLTHDNEWQRETNTGRWLTKSLDECQAYSWSRVSANTALQARIAQPNTRSFLVYPSEESVDLEHALTSLTAEESAHFIVLDATWQEARKMERKSPWLADLPRVHLTTQQASAYRLRRNQQQGNLCTLEVGLALLRQFQAKPQTDALEQFYHYSMNVFQADKSGHRWMAGSTFPT
ncbi:TPA: tRNA-uridine aminocarboxypropyltransferase [Vibrio mimicus]|uniref:tRNA-uridine aminocarboxypropyltransferase n=1 Tax=Vibrio mimicus TaxID=674 RepID=UPI001302ADDE|nr:tRNA-uridine aminocarboxypropyltransferase [Vibrio mimicus]